MDPYEKLYATWNKIAQVCEDKFMKLAYYDETYAAFCASMASENPQIFRNWMWLGLHNSKSSAVKT